MIIAEPSRHEVTVADVLRFGTVGLGIDESSSPLVIVDRRCFRLAADSRVAETASNARVTFAVVTNFSPDVVMTIAAPTDVATLSAFVERALPRGNFLVSVRIDASFAWVRVEDAGDPNAPSSAPIAGFEGRVSEWRESVGTLIGIRLPEEADGSGSTVIRFVYVNHSRDHGGYVTDFLLKDANVELSFSTGARLAVPKLGVRPGPRPY